MAKRDMSAQLRKLGFKLVNTGGGIMGWSRFASSVGEAFISDLDGGAPTWSNEAAYLMFIGHEHSQPLVTLYFARLEDLVDSLKAGREAERSTLGPSVLD